MKNIYYLIIFALLFIIGCSSSQETDNSQNQSDKDSVYVFDEVPTQENFPPEPIIEKPSPAKSTQFIVQIGAYTSQSKADEFASFSRRKLNKEVIVSYSGEVNLWVVQLSPFNTRQEAEKSRNELWKIKEFTDSFIIRVEK